jgi:surfactin synthase thioesterase subunit
VTNDNNITLLIEKYQGDRDLLSSHMSILNRYVTRGRIKSPIHTIEALNNRVPCNMVNWKDFTQDDIHPSFIEGDHWNIFLENNLPQIEKALRSNSLTLFKTDI